MHEVMKYVISMTDAAHMIGPESDRFDSDPITATRSDWRSDDPMSFADSLAAVLFAVRDMGSLGTGEPVFGGPDATVMAAYFLTDCISREERGPYGRWYRSPQEIADGDALPDAKRSVLKRLEEVAHEYLTVCRDERKAAS